MGTFTQTLIMSDQKVSTVTLVHKILPTKNNLFKHIPWSYNKDFFVDLKSSIISAVTQNSVDHNQVNNNDNSNAGNAFGGHNEAKRCKTGSNRD